MTTRSRLLRKWIPQVVVTVLLVPLLVGFMVRAAPESSASPAWIPGNPPTSDGWPVGRFGCEDWDEWWRESNGGKHVDEPVIQGWMSPLLYGANRPDGAIEPESMRAATDQPYCFEAGHCGLDHIIDFDGSFWKPAPSARPVPPGLRVNSSLGAIRLIDHHHAEFTPWWIENERAILGTGQLEYTEQWGQPIPLERINGPIVPAPCW